MIDISRIIFKLSKYFDRPSSTHVAAVKRLLHTSKERFIAHALPIEHQ